MTTMPMMNPFCLKLIQSIFLTCLVLQADLVCSKEVVRCIQTERQALLQFKAGLIDEFGMLSSWTTADCCEWYGIGCSNLTGHVVMLDLHGDYYNGYDDKFYIRGDIDKSLMELKQLKYLNFSRNYFKGSNISCFFGSLRNLRYLDLSHCRFGGKIPIQFESLLHLKYLSLSSNDLDGLISRQLGNLSNVRFIDLSNNHLEGSIPSKLGNLSNLQFLDLSYNRLDGSIPSELENLSNLKFLHLHSNYLEGRIPFQLGNLSNLQYLDLLGNSFKGKIPSQLGKLLNLQELYLGGGYGRDSTLTIDDNEDQNGGKWLCNLTSLTHLQMLSVSNLDRWLQMVGELPKLKELSLESCGLSDRIILSPSSLKLNFSSSLSVLDLSRNNFVSFNIFEWVSNISPNLIHLDLSVNQMVDPTQNYSATKMIRRLPKLRELILSDNMFTSFMIFQWVSNISSDLVELDLSRNFLEDPPSYGHGIEMKSLESLDLSKNTLKGGAFKFFTNLCSLHSLNFYKNPFTKDLQSIIQNLSSGCLRNSLESLVLMFNQITGTLPDLSMFTSLKTLDLSFNHLSGKIPEGSSLPFQLENLSIRSNSLEGAIPKSFWINACKLKSLDLTSNSFSDELQVIIQHLSRCARYSLQELALSSNQINGTISDLSIFSSLEIFDISENRVNGKIFEDIRFPTTLRTLRMDSNSLSGVISDIHFSSMSMLRELNLSDNSLVLRFTESWVPPFQLRNIGLRACKLGLTFPKWIQTQKYLQDLDISNAGISDNVSEWFWAKLSSQECYRINISYNNLKGSIPNLQVKNLCNFLSLSSNEFEGPIPPLLRGSVFIDLSHNKLSDCRPFLCANGIDEMLAQFDFSNNKLSERIPDIWSNFKSLIYVDLSHNNFSGKIPTSMGSLVKLQALLLSNNNLTEEIPSSLMNCTKLVMLDLRENRLEGLVPSWIGTELKELQVLSLNRNHFFGSIPFELCHLQNIQLFDLSLNILSGKIPKCITNFTSMTQKDPSQGRFYHGFSARTGASMSYGLSAFLTWKGAEHVFNSKELNLLKSIDLSSNYFSEVIPPEIADLIQLVSLNLSRNNFTGKIPSYIGNLTSLDFLDLSRNNLLGSIPSSLSQIDRLGVLDLSHNQLSGEIPKSTHNFKVSIPQVMKIISIFVDHHL